MLVAQSCLTLYNPKDYNPQGSSVHGILQVRILEGVGLPFPSPGDLPGPGIEPRYPAIQADSLPSSYKVLQLLDNTKHQETHTHKWPQIPALAASIPFCNVTQPFLSLGSTSGLGHTTCFGQRNIKTCDASRGLKSGCMSEPLFLDALRSPITIAM